MRIAMLSTCALATPPRKYGGTELVVAELTKGLIELGHDVIVYATGDSSVRGELRHHFAKPVWPPNELAEMRHAGFAWQDIAHEREPFDVVHAHHPAALPLHWVSNRPMVQTVHHARMDELEPHYTSFPEVAFVSISDRQAKLWPAVPFARTIHHGLDPSAYPFGRGDAGHLAFLGRFAPEKAPHLAIDAARAAGSRLVLGGAPHTQLAACREYFEREMQPRLANATDVEWRGELGHKDKVELLAGARALLFPLRWEEPFGLVMIEAMLVGTPVIAFASGSTSEVVEHGVTGYLVRDEREMAECIRRVGNLDRARCRARAVERWSSRRMALDHVELYEQLVRKHPQRSRTEHAGRIVRAARSPSVHSPSVSEVIVATARTLLATGGSDGATSR